MSRFFRRTFRKRESPPAQPEKDASMVTPEENRATEALDMPPSTPEAALALAEVEAADGTPSMDMPITLPNPTLLDAEYPRSIDHLWNELRRIDLLISARVCYWLAYIDESPDAEDEARRMLRSQDIMPDAWLEGVPRNTAREIRTLVEQAERELEAIAGRIRLSEVELRLETLSVRYGLSRLERDVLLLCLWSELDERYRRVYGFLMSDSQLLLPSIRLITEILLPTLAGENGLRARLDRARDVFAPDAPLLREKMIALSQVDNTPLSQALVCVDARIVSYLLESDAPDPRLKGFVEIAKVLPQPDPWQRVPQDVPLLESLRSVASWAAGRYLPARQGSTLLFVGKYGSGQYPAALAISQIAEARAILRVDVAAALRSGMPWDEVVRRVHRDAGLRGRASVYWAGCDTLIADAAAWGALTRAAEACDSLTFIEASQGWTPVDQFREHDFVQVDFSLPSYELRQQLWREHLAALLDEEPSALHPDYAAMLPTLASGFPFTAEQVADAVVAARGLATQRGRVGLLPLLDDLLEGCRLQGSHGLEALAQRIEPRDGLTEGDLILPPASKLQFRELIRHLNLRDALRTRLDLAQRFQLGRGTVVLFTGSSGTGKTMAAEILAKELHAAIYRVDMAALVDKYVGETEKNLNRIFTVAEGTNAILFFDEADAMFGKRGEVKEANDRWANLEVNYLLQRIEQYSGVVILTSNLRQNIDEAFLRRIQTCIEFPFPDETRRALIWERSLRLRDCDGQLLHFPDAEYHAIVNEEWRRRLEEQLRQHFNIAARDVAAAMQGLTRGDIRGFIDPLFEALPGDAFDDLLKAEIRTLAECFRVSGGNIKNIVVDATVRALSESEDKGAPLRLLMRHLIVGTAREYQKLGKPMTRGDFGDLFYEWAVEDMGG
jgi:DNA polymerase III delta prime subunit